ncbi:MAG: fructosamine kinase family protein [Bacteroidia bacterium]|nr:fructosamine kinase family protein [Bacteroidia bacterium]
MNPTYIQKAIEKVLGKQTHLYGLHHVGGGFINQTYKAITSMGTYFIKVHASDGFTKLFEKEIHGLQILKQANSIAIVDKVGVCEYEKFSFLILEWVETAPQHPHFWSILGKGIAKMHQCKNRFFGFSEDNYLGSLVQPNNRSSSWGQFFVKHRIMPQVKIAIENNYFTNHTIDLFEKYYSVAETIFPLEDPSLLHGDLWLGNIMTNAEGLPCLVDPAAYYGHREMDIAMTYFVGNFEPEFYEAYHSVYPLKPDWESRKDFGLMYYQLAHLNLFGDSYLPMVEANLNRWVGEKKMTR